MKRFLAVFLTMCMIVSVPAFAEDASRQEPVSEQLIDKEIRERVQYRLDAVSEQLEGVDERYASIYREYITDITRNEILLEKGVASANTDQAYLPNGGVVSWTNETDPSGDIFYIVVTLLNYEDSYQYLLDNFSEPMSAWDYVLMLLGYVPYVGPVVSTLLNIDTIVSNSQLRDISDADGYIMIESVGCKILGGPEVTDGLTVARGWHDHPYYYYPSYATEQTVEIEF